MLTTALDHSNRFHAPPVWTSGGLPVTTTSPDFSRFLRVWNASVTREDANVVPPRFELLAAWSATTPRQGTCEDLAGVLAAEPRVDIDPQAWSFLVGESLQDVYHALLQLVTRVAEESDVRVVRTRASYFSDPEESQGEVVVTQVVQLEGEPLLSYWEHLSRAVEGLASDPSRRELLGRIALEVVPASDD